MAIQLQEKPKATPKGPSQLRELVPYEVVAVNKSEIGVEVGDIVLRFPAHSHGSYVLNVTKQKMLWDKGHNDSWNEPFTCLRAHHVAKISFAEDHDELPE